jgi:Flp pilus assembly protein TadB
MMQNPVLLSTALLTMLLSVGLFFFIRASAKDRTQIVQLVAEQQEEPLFEQLAAYFAERSYQLAAVDAERNQIKYEGYVRPSLFLAIFLTFLAAIGIFCLSLVLSFLFPSLTSVFPALVLISPIAGGFYWRKAGRPEQVTLHVETIDSPNLPDTASQSLLTVAAHRDEVLTMRRVLNLKEFEPGD